jgi:hypothetical protein
MTRNADAFHARALGIAWEPEPMADAAPQPPEMVESYLFQQVCAAYERLAAECAGAHREKKAWRGKFLRASLVAGILALIDIALIVSAVAR